MKFNRIILPAMAATMLLAGCDDTKMEWGTPDGHYPVTSADIPLAVKEVLANYGNIKDYAAQYTPQMTIGLGLGASKYVSDADYKSIADANFQMFTTGNAMKMDAIVGNSGTLDFTSLDEFLDAMPSDTKLYGHNFIWHTQQQQSYLQTLIAPKKTIEAEGGIANELSGDATNFNGGTSGGWGSWGSNKESASVIDGVGPDGTAAMALTSKADGNFWEAQFAYTFDTPLKKDVVYMIKFQAKSSVAAGQIQFQYQNGSTYGSQGGYNTFDIGTEWATYQYEFTITDYDDVNRIILNFGKVGATYYIDNIEFGQKVEDPMDNMLGGIDTDFEGDESCSWGSWGSNKNSAGIESGVGQNGTSAMVLTNNGDGNFWEAQFAYTFDSYLSSSTTYMIQFYAKSSTAAGKLQVQYQNGSTYGSQGLYAEFEVGTDWTLCEKEFTPAYDDVNRIIINFGKVGGTYYIDNVKFGPKKSTSAKRHSPMRASKVTWTFKTADEKREALLGFMDTWIKGMADHLAEKGIVPYAYDVINEPITDGDCKVRGVDGVFGGTWTEGEDDDAVTYYDSEPTEDTENGLTLNWGSGHFYWGYYVKDFAVQAFSKARQYLPAETKLFVNDYNLETSPNKLAALIQFAKDIDSAYGSTVVDGIGTQMHLSISATDDEDANAELIAELKTKVDAMFTTMAATGKLVRVTELDVALGTSSPSSAAYQAQADIYEMVFNSYKENVPTAQQSGITIWGLSDAEDEHTYWLTGELPNLWDAKYLRKWAYKGVCDGIAGEDLGLQYGGDDYKAYYEKQNVSDTVK